MRCSIRLSVKPNRVASFSAVRSRRTADESVAERKSGLEIGPVNAMSNEKKTENFTKSSGQTLRRPVPSTRNTIERRFLEVCDLLHCAHSDRGNSFIRSLLNPERTLDVSATTARSNKPFASGR